LILGTDAFYTERETRRIKRYKQTQRPSKQKDRRTTFCLGRHRAGRIERETNRLFWTPSPSRHLYRPVRRISTPSLATHVHIKRAHGDITLRRKSQFLKAKKTMFLEKKDAKGSPLFAAAFFCLTSFHVVYVFKKMDGFLPRRRESFITCATD